VRPVAPSESDLEKPKTLADSLKAQEKAPSLNDRLRDSKGGARLSADQIPLHKQFQFIQKVFDGNSDFFRKTLAAISELDSAEEANEYLRTRILNMPNVNREDKVTQEFVLLVNTAFGN
jgi:hypothetical protein